jgi:hypothetical protein
VLTTVGRAVLELVDKHFPPGNTLRKIFNLNTIKISYSCMNNMASIIKGHNKKVLINEKASSAGCNCRNKNNFPLDKQCSTTATIYQAKVFEPKKEDDPKVYIGMA